MGRLPAIPRNLAQVALAGLALVLSSAACTTANLRRYTYAPELAYIERSELKTHMHQLAQAVNRVDGRLRQATLSEADRNEIRSTLESMVAVAEELGRGGETNHPELDASLTKFAHDVRAAAADAAKDPPNYFLAGTVTAACTYCHR